MIIFEEYMRTWWIEQDIIDVELAGLPAIYETTLWRGACICWFQPSGKDSNHYHLPFTAEPTFFKPSLCIIPMAFGARAVLAGIIWVIKTPAMITLEKVSAKRLCAALGNVPQSSPVAWAGCPGHTGPDSPVRSVWRYQLIQAWSWINGQAADWGLVKFNREVLYC